MTNPIIPKEEVQLLEVVIKAIKELKKVHNSSRIKEEVINSNDLEKAHVLTYLKALKDLVSSTIAIEQLFEMPSEDFEDLITEEGRVTVSEYLRVLMMSMILEKD